MKRIQTETENETEKRQPTADKRQKHSTRNSSKRDYQFKEKCC